PALTFPAGSATLYPSTKKEKRIPMKKLLAILLALMLVVSLAACASSNDTTTDSTDTADTTDTTDTTDTADTTDTTDTTDDASDAVFTTVEAGKLHMSTNAAFPPYEMVADGEGFEGTGYEGIDVEIAYAI